MTRIPISALAEQWRAVAPESWQAPATAAHLGLDSETASRVLSRGAQLGYWHRERTTWRLGARPAPPDPRLRSQRILDSLQARPYQTSEEVASELGYSLQTVRNALCWLAAKGIVTGSVRLGKHAKRWSIVKPTQLQDGRGRHDNRPKSGPKPRGAKKAELRHRLEEAEVRSLIAQGFITTRDLAERTGMTPRVVCAVRARLRASDNPPPEPPKPKRNPRPSPWKAPQTDTAAFLRALLDEPWSTPDELPPCPDLPALVAKGLVTVGKGGALCATDAARLLVRS